jgi:tetratricopeptide (TPR) repeat protein
MMRPVRGPWWYRARRAGWGLVGLGLLVSASWVVVRAWAAPTSEEFSRWVGWANVFASASAALGMALLVIDRTVARASEQSSWQRPGEINNEVIEEAVSDLADLAHSMATELSVAKMPVGWEITRAAAAAMRAISSETLTGDTTTVSDLVTRNRGDVRVLFDHVASGRLVVLGPSGAGKSFLSRRMVRSLLDHPRADRRVPVLMSAALWDPTTRSLAAEIAEQVCPAGSRLGRRCRDGQGRTLTYARVLVHRQRVLPIIDGLDEMQPWLRPTAIHEINSHDGPLLVTSRTKEYLDALDPKSERIISQALVVELQPLSVPEIKHYLDPNSTGEWSEVLDRLDVDPQGPLAKVLANPLMLWVARMSCRKNPSKVVEQARFASRTTIERRLLAGFVPAIYAPGQEPHQRERGRFRCTPEQAERWLRFLAGEFPDRCEGLSDGSVGPVEIATLADLPWWRLTSAARGWRSIGMGIRGALLTFVVGALLCWVLKQIRNWPAGTYAGLRDLLLGGPLGHVVRPAVEQLFSSLPSDVRALAARPVTSLPDKAGQAWSYLAHQQGVAWPLSLLLLLVLPMCAYLLFQVDYYQMFREYFPRCVTVRPVRPYWTVISALTRMLGYPLVTAAAALGLFVLLVNLSAHPDTVRLLIEWRSVRNALFLVSLLGLMRVTSSFIAVIDTAGTISPRKALTLDRRADLILTVVRRSVFAVVVGLLCGAQVARMYAVYAVTATAVAVTLGGRPGGQRSFASRAYIDARFWLACRGRLPWRIMDFLDDARRRGVLRQVGAVHQFRHIRLQQALRDPWERRHKSKHSFKRDQRWERKLQLRRGRRRLELEKALDTLNDNVDNDRRLASAEASATRKLALARSLWHRAHTLASLDRWEEAATDQAECVDLYGELAAEDPTLLPVRASALVSLAACFQPIGWGEGWLGATSQALQIYRELVDAMPAKAQPDWIPRVDSVTSDLHRVASGHYSGNRGRLTLDWSDPSVATQFADECRTAVEIYRGMAERDPPTFLERLATSLSDLSWSLTTLERREEAAAAANEAADLLSQLLMDTLATSPGEDSWSERNRKTYLGSLLGNVLLRLWKLGQREKALAAGEAIGELIRIEQPLRAPRQDQPDARRVKVKEVQRIRHFLRKVEDLPHVPRGWLRNLDARLAEAEVQARIRESLRPLWSSDDLFFRGIPLDFDPEVAGKRAQLLSKRSMTCRRRVDRYSKKVTVFEERSTRRVNEEASRNLAKARTALIQSLKELAEAQRQLADVWDKLVFRWTVTGVAERATVAAGETLRTYIQVTETYRYLNRESQDCYLPELAKSLEALAFQLNLAGRQTQARRVAREADEIGRELRATWR